ncbi:3-deoxy-manno-octulosonate cytidylyltransferase [Candidatus Pelagibacter sp.]|uniref:3-deoxy-manno-octulosonate cytidylyltransferase n=1 Tax=Candidatus Pelagibacter sp. TaxID=2024849 RepID=UPI003F87CA0A
MKKIIIVIPCRLKSKRLKEKLIRKVNGKEIFLHTYERCCLAINKKNIYIATDSSRIITLCKEKGINVVKTSQKKITGSDRIEELSKKIRAENYINVQGDEPIIDPKNIKKVIQYTKKDNSKVYNCYTEINQSEAKKKSIPKVILNNNEELIYMSRSIVPFNHTNAKIKYFKQVCIYSYPRRILNIFNNKKTKIENNEDIEILRLIENGISVKMIKVKTNSFAIDTIQDYKKLKKILK